MAKMDLEQFRKEGKEGGAAKKTYIAFGVEDEGYELVVALKSKGYDVKAVVTHLLKQIQ